MIELNNISKVYPLKSGDVYALKDINLTLGDSGMVFILGKSGSGKSTLLNILGGLDNYTSGNMIIDGVSTDNYRKQDYDSYRNDYVGFVFQEYYLIDDFNVRKNIDLALELKGEKDRTRKIDEALKIVGLEGYAERKIVELSGGQKQRVAIARAIVKSPHIILADEPTGNLDSSTSTEIFDLLKELSRDRLVVVVSHDRESAEKYADRIVEICDGKIMRDTYCHTVEGEQYSSMETKHNVKLSRGNLSFCATMSYALNNMKDKIGRIIASIILFVLSLALLGFSMGVSRYDVVKTTQEAYKKSGYSTISLYVGNNMQLFDYADTTFGGNVVPVYEGDMLHRNKNSGLSKKFNARIMTTIDENIAQRLGYDVLYGRLPSKAEEVCVQKFSLEKELAQNEEYWSERGIVDIESLYEAIHNDFNYDIVGVIDTHVPKIFDEFLKNPTEDEMNKWEKDKLFLYDEYCEQSQIFTCIMAHPSYFDKYYIPRMDEFTWNMNTAFGSKPAMLHPGRLSVLATSDYSKIDGVDSGVVTMRQDAYDAIYKAGLNNQLADSSLESLLKVLADNEVEVQYITRNHGKWYKFRIIGVIEDDRFMELTKVGDDRIYLSDDIVEKEFQNTTCIKNVVFNINDTESLGKAISISNIMNTDRTESIYFPGRINKAVESIQHSIAPFKIFALVASLIFGLMTAITMLSFFLSTIKDKSQEIAILRAIGVKNGNVLLIFLYEAIIITAISLLVAIPLCYSISFAFENFEMAAMSNNTNAFIHFVNIDVVCYAIILAMAASIVVLGVVLPFVKLMKMKPMDIIRKNG